MNVISSLIPVFTLLLGAFLTYYFSIKEKKKEMIFKFKEEQYSQLLIKLQAFITHNRQIDEKRAAEFLETRYINWIYASDDVVKSINYFLELIIEKNESPDNEEKAIGAIVIAMRKDLVGNTKLSYSDFRYINLVPPALKAPFRGNI
ncbi:MAG: hypothetical protein GY730_00820 [bacterium]|nr:hypothetical protein [bacterium]